MESMAQDTEIDAVVVGAGQAGISLSYYLSERGVGHVVLERDTAFSSWRRRWDDFRTNTPNWMNTLPMLPEDRIPSGDGAAFATREEMIEYFEECLAVVDPPLLLGEEVERISEVGDGDWEVQAGMTYRARCVALCTGAMSRPRIPGFASELPGDVAQIHSSEYLRPSQIATGRVLIVGSASSGVQICRLLAESGRFEQVHLAASRVMVLPKSILGVQTHRFLHKLGLFDITTTSPLGKVMWSGLESRGDPIMRPDPKDLARTHGVQVHPRVTGFEDDRLRFADGGTVPLDDLTIVWCTGYQGDYGLIEKVGLSYDGRGVPRHERGVAEGAPGLHFVGLRYQHTVASHDIYGVANDARFVADQIQQRLASIGSSLMS
jgi:putative flavoprotein involved in K+ transport